MRVRLDVVVVHVLRGHSRVFILSSSLFRPVIVGFVGNFTC